MKRVLPRFLAFGALAAVLVLIFAAIPREPRYEGETLSYWMAHWYRGMYGAQPLVDASAKAAVREIGTNGLGYYVRWMNQPLQRSTDTDYQSWALRGFEFLGPNAKAAIPDLVKMLGKGGNRPALALAYIGKDSISALTNYLATNTVSIVRIRSRPVPVWWGRQNALCALRFMGTNAESALPCLIQCIEGGDSRIQADATATLAVVGRNRPRTVVPVLIRALTNWVGYSRANAADALASFGSEARTALPALVLASQCPDPYVRTHVATATKSISPETPGALDPLIENLTNRNALVRQQALWALERIGTNGLEALPAIQGCLRDPVPDLRTIAMRCIYGIGYSSDDVITGLVENLSHDNSFVRSAAISTLAGLAEKSVSAFTALVRARGSSQKEVRGQARNSVITIGNKTPSLLVACFTNADAEIRYGAFQILYYDVGMDVSTAVDALVQALHDEDARVRDVATNTLRRLDPQAARSRN